jgi:hypothetical protein
MHIATCLLVLVRGFDSAASEDDVTKQVNAWIRTTGVETRRQACKRVANSLEYETTVLGDEVNSQCLPAEKSIGKANLRPTATKLQEMSVPGTRQEFHA